MTALYKSSVSNLISGIFAKVSPARWVGQFLLLLVMLTSSLQLVAQTPTYVYLQDGPTGSNYKIYSGNDPDYCDQG